MTSVLESPTHLDVAPAYDALPDSSARAAGREHRRSTTAALLEQASQTTHDLERRRLLDELVTLNMEVARAISARYRGRGVSDDDLAQVAYVGLVRAAQAFDPSFDRDFLAYAVPTIRGEVRKYFRDRAWAVRPPRRLQELQPRLALARQELGHELGRSPRPAEVADHLGVDEEEVIEALAAYGCFSPTSLDRSVGEDGSSTLADLVGAADPGLGAAEARLILAPVMESLSDRDRHIVYLRFFSQLTQREIAEDIGVTQMQVSRLLTRILSQLRQALQR
jgi:RNA polymerase sigma-B factor